MPDNPSHHTFIHKEAQAALFQQGNESALSFFFHELHPTLSLFAYYRIKDRESAKDIASAAFVKTWKFNYKLGSYAAIKAYLYKVVTRDCQVALRQHRNILTDNLSLFPDASEEDPYQHLLRAETYSLLHKAIRSLAPGYQRVISMYYLEGKSSGEIARELNKPADTIRALKLKSLKALRRSFLNPVLIVLYFSIKFF